MQIGKKTEGEMIDTNPEKKEGFATATFDLEANRWQRARWPSPVPITAHAALLERS